MATKNQIKIIHTLKSALCLDEGTYRAVLANYGAESSKDLDVRTAEKLVRELERQATAAGVWQPRPRRREYGRRPGAMKGRGGSRAAQLGKIEALLTVGGKSWGYADALAKRICGVDRAGWVPEEDLYKIITALRKQAQREGWDLSGEK